MALPPHSSSDPLSDNGFDLRETEMDGAVAREAKDPGVEESSAKAAGASLPEGWRRLPTGRRGARLYEVSQPGRAHVYWEAGMTLDGKRLRRRFASELQARAWLTVTNEPHRSEVPQDREEIHGAIRIAGVAGGSRAPLVPKVDITLKRLPARRD